MSNKSKKIRNARIIATDIFMFIAVIAIVFLMMLIAMGFKFNDDGNLEQSGLLQISSYPGSAKVNIDGNDLLMPTEISKLLSVGQHDVKVTKTGYDTWNAKVNIESGLLTEINWVRLFPLNPKISQVDTFDVAPNFVSVSTSNKYMLVSTKGSDHFDLLSLQEEKVKSTTIPFTSIITIAANEGESEPKPLSAEEFAVVAWSNNDNKILIKHIRDGNVNWVLLNISKNIEAINLTNVFNKKFAQILFENDGGTKAWALAENQLYQLDFSSKTTSKIIANQVQKIANNDDTVAYIASSDEDFVSPDEATEEIAEVATNKIFVYKDGEEASTLVAELESTEASSMLEMGTYWSTDWLAYNKDNKVYIRSGVYPSYNKNTLEDFPAKETKELEFVPIETSTNKDGRVIVFANGDKVSAFEFETKSITNYTSDAPISHFNWLDNYLLWQQKDNKLIIWDFDGNNHREIVQKLCGNYPVMLSANNKYLYYFTSEELTSNTDNTVNNLQESVDAAQDVIAPATTKTIYHLTRMNLNQ